MSKPRKINVEPLQFLMFFSFGLYTTVNTAFLTFKHCLWLLDPDAQVYPNPHDYCLRLGSGSSVKPNFTASTLTGLDPDTEYLNLVQAATARFMTIYQIVSTVPTIFMAVFIGAWSDTYGRKPSIIIASAGSAIALQVSVAAAAVDAIPVYVMLAPAFIKGFTGQVIVIYGGVYSMISDVASSPRQLTMRMALAGVAGSIGSLSAQLASAFILQRWDDYTLIFLCCGISTFLAFLYAVFGLQETIQFSKKHLKNERIWTTGNEVDGIDNTVQSNHEIITDKKRKCKCCCGSFFNVERIKESVRILIKPRSGRRRFYLLITLVSMSILFATESSGMLNLFAKRPPLNFTNSQYSFLTSISSAMMFAPAIATWLFKTSDMCLIITGLAVRVVKMIMIAFSTEQWMLYTALGVGGLSDLYFTGFRSLVTKLIEPTETVGSCSCTGHCHDGHEHEPTKRSSHESRSVRDDGLWGRLFATMATVDHLTPLLASTIFNNLYAATLTWFPGFIFLVSAAFTLPLLTIMSYVYIDMKRRIEDFGERKSSIGNNEDQEALIHAAIE